ncbi:sulfurtransferase complex subunit TusB [Chlorobium phaeobacteroides]|jgi:tRNA 2-thiouridine synthesizing protein B|uniref:DsrH family protein n=1 Tax=Chlorobium phaeobacteroides (strain DSM 266 / SMG 266 / 2430) TaxID=290317 RepID=A1BCS7_CHLPD|nr:sulfurtransferase complex subunit TusB [Chlorobium phaeobacteroides]ABL64204.1 DsrH family protein [Chlorobium phaeobacteroides DSM 266]MBV5328778.1 sulfurtransferase complex subunit TusB [Chlorobium sp.]
MLHTINKSPFASDTFDTCGRFLLPGDPVLFIEDGVYAVQAGNRFSSMIETIQKTNPVFALRPDLDARGIAAVDEGVTLVDYEGFVELVENHQVNSWL